MLHSMSNELRHIHFDIKSPKSMMLHLEEMLGEHGKSTRYNLSKEFFHTRMRESGEVASHVMNMISMIGRLQTLGSFMDFHL